MKCVKGNRCGNTQLCGQCRLIKKNPDFDDSLTTRQSVNAEDSVVECPHLGEPTGQSVGCRSCSGLVPLPTHHCGRYGLTVLGNLAPASDTVRACRWCPENPANQRQRPPVPIVLFSVPGKYLVVAEPPASVVTTRPSSTRVVVTAVVGDEAERMHAASGPAQRAFAKSVGADYLVLRWNPLPNWPMACKFGMYAALAPGLWDTLLWMDTDALPLPGCINPFALVAPGRIGVYDERPFHIVQPQFELEESFDRFRTKMGFQPARPTMYFNAGVMVVPATHREILAPPRRLWVEDAGATTHNTGRHCAEQHLLNARLWEARHRLPFQPVDRRFNWQSWPDKGLADAPEEAILHWSGGPDRHRRPEMMAQMVARRPWPVWTPPARLFPTGPHEYAVDPSHVRLIRDELLTGRYARVLEVGCHHGYSTCAFLDAARSGAVRETHLCDPHPTAELSAAVGHYAAPGVTTHAEPSLSLLARDAAYDLAMLDGDHAAEVVTAEVKLLATAGCRTIFAHDVSTDMGPACLPGVLRELGYAVTVDDAPRLGERTGRGLMKATKADESGEK